MKTAMKIERVLKNLLLMSALAGALALAAPSQAGERYRGAHFEHYHYDARPWRGGHGYRHDWGPRAYGYHYAPPHRYYPVHYHRHYRGCGHHPHGLVGYVIDYSRYDD